MKETTTEVDTQMKEKSDLIVKNKVIVFNKETLKITGNRKFDRLTGKLLIEVEKNIVKFNKPSIVKQWISFNTIPLEVLLPTAEPVKT